MYSNKQDATDEDNLQWKMTLRLDYTKIAFLKKIQIWVIVLILQQQKKKKYSLI